MADLNPPGYFQRTFLSLLLDVLPTLGRSHNEFLVIIELVIV